MKCFPDEVSELIPCVEYMIYNTPGPHGYTPRDIDRRWSMGTPLERELHGQVVNESEPMSERARIIFKAYEQVRQRVLQVKRQDAMRRADLSNRRRYGKRVEVWDKVLVRDNRPGRTGGRTMCKSPLSEPATVTRVNHHKLPVQFADGKTSEVHLERVLQIPRGYYDPEHSTLPLPGPGADVMPDIPATGSPGAPAQEPGTVQRRSPGRCWKMTAEPFGSTKSR